MAISDQDLEGILQQAANLKYKGLDPNASIALIRESVAGYNQQKPPAKAVDQVEPQAEINIDSAYQTLCRLIESDRNLVQFGVFSVGNVTGRGDTKGRASYGYDPQKREVVAGYRVLPDIVDMQSVNDPPTWEKRLFRFSLDTQLVIGVRQWIQGEQFSQVVSDDRGGNSYSVGIRITFKGIDYDANSEGRLMLFVNDLFQKHPTQFMELMDKLADRYVPFYNAGIKTLEARYRQQR